MVRYRMIYRCLFVSMSLALSLVSCAPSDKPSSATSSGQNAISATYEVHEDSGTPIWVPSANIQNGIVAGTTVTATLVNNLADTHIFQVSGSSDTVSVAPSSTVVTTFQVSGNAAGSLAVYCPFHNAGAVNSGLIILH